MANYYFRLREPNADKPTPIILFAQVNGNRIKCKTNESVLPDQWDHELKMPKAKVKANKTLINRLNFLLSVADGTFLYFRDTKKVAVPNANEFQERFYEVAGIESTDTKKEQPKELTLFEFIDKFISEAKHRQNEYTGEPIAQNTIKVYNQCKRLLQEFHTTRYRLSFNRLKLDFYLDFKEYLNDKKYGPNTVAKHIRTLKTFINDANERGYFDGTDHTKKRFRAKQVETDTIYLNETELKEIHKLDLTKTPPLDRVRDLFLVGCYTGLRFSDFTNIGPENIDGDFIEIRSEKTKIDTVIPIHLVVREIMRKYEGKYINSLPPAISNQKFNEYIKEVCKLCPSLQTPVNTDKSKPTKVKGLRLHKDEPKYKHVSSHTARRSFATNQYNKGVSASFLMKITGHRTETSFYKYIRVTPKENAQRLRELWQKEISHLKVV